MPRGTILVVEDDAAIRRGIVDALRFAGYQTFEAADGQVGLSSAIGAEIDLVLLDILMPKMDGFAVLEELRRVRPALPVIVLTARGAEDDRVRGLRGGADDYVVKPFSAKELLARVEAVLRRSAERPQAVAAIRIAGRTIDFERREIRQADGQCAVLSVREAAILQYLAANRGRAIDRSELLARVWGFDPRGVRTRTVDMHIARLRERLGDDPVNPTVICTVRGKGYMLAAEEDA
ncbi:MAG: response regulator transcription factor [Phycisphaerae bacterium]|nr:response regulator transcription factor [Phycisphaerae bacterium]